MQTQSEQNRAIGWFGPRWVTSEYLTTGNPEAGLGGGAELTDSLMLAKAPGEQALPSTTLTLEQLVSRHLSARRESYVDRAWRVFREASGYRDSASDEPVPTYQDAQRLLNLADTAALDVAEEKPAIKLAIAYTGIAAGQYAEAGNALGWFLYNGWDPQALSFKAPYVRALRDMRDFGRFYGQRADYERHNAALEDFDSRAVQAHSAAQTEFSANPQSTDAQTTLLNARAQALKARALLVLVDWGRGNLTSGNTRAGEVAKLAAGLSLPPGWSEIATLLRQATEPVPEPVESQGPGLPVWPGVAGDDASSPPPESKPRTWAPTTDE